MKEKETDADEPSIGQESGYSEPSLHLLDDERVAAADGPNESKAPDLK